LHKKKKSNKCQTNQKQLFLQMNSKYNQYHHHPKENCANGCGGWNGQVLLTHIVGRTEMLWSGIWKNDEKPSPDKMSTLKWLKLKCSDPFVVQTKGKAEWSNCRNST
jgi:hypothetical protein